MITISLALISVFTIQIAGKPNLASMLLYRVRLSSPPFITIKDLAVIDPDQVFNKMLGIGEKVDNSARGVGSLSRDIPVRPIESDSPIA
jgi:hypothetical protein